MRDSIIYLLRLLYGELNDQNVDLWLHDQLRGDNNILEYPRTESASIIRFQQVIDAIKYWLKGDF